jgi:formylglycine-generating enzyme required for sulfatase activity
MLNSCPSTLPLSARLLAPLPAPLSKSVMALVLQHRKATAKYFTQSIAPDIQIDMVYIPGGTFEMGSPETEERRASDEGPQHTVTLPAFFMGKYPVTQAQWQAVVDRTPQITRQLDPQPSGLSGNDHPVERVSWDDAIEFCARLSRLSDREYTLPSEAQWEYACRAGTVTPFHFGGTIDTAIANYDGNRTYGEGKKGSYREKTTPVGSFEVANAFGLYDMHGNVWEWCMDHWHGNYTNSPNNGSAWIDQETSENVRRVLRGGSWFNYPGACRSAVRDRFDAAYRNTNIGFRLISPARILP